MPAGTSTGVLWLPASAVRRLDHMDTSSTDTGVSSGVDSGTVTIRLDDGSTMRGYRSRPVGTVRPTAVIVAHELFGVNEDIKGIVDDLSRAGYVSVAPEFYHRHTAPGRALQRDDAGRTEGFTLLRQLTRADALADVSAALRWLTADPVVTDVAMIGFSAGGHLAYYAATQLPLRVTAVVYGGWLTSTEIPLSRPNPTLELTGGIAGHLSYLVGDRDFLIDAAQRDQIEQALTRAGVDHQLVVHPGAEHAYFWPGTPAYHPEARQRAWHHILAMLDRPASRRS